MSSAAIVSPRMRLSANATSSGMFLSRWWQTISMSRCSSSVLIVNGRVGLVELGRTFGSPQTRMMSGRVAAAGAFRCDTCESCVPLNAAIESPTKPDSFSVSVWIVTCTSYFSATAETAIDRRGRRAPVFVQLQADRAGADLLDEALRAPTSCLCP